MFFFAALVSSLKTYRNTQFLQLSSVNVNFTQLFTMIGPENSRHPLNQSDAKLANNRDLVICVFPRAKQSPCFLFEFLLANNDVNLWSAQSLETIWFWSFETQLKTCFNLLAL